MTRGVHSLVRDRKTSYPVPNCSIPHHVKDLTTNRLFLVDSGNEVSLIPRDPGKFDHSTGRDVTWLQRRRYSCTRTSSPHPRSMFESSILLGIHRHRRPIPYWWHRRFPGARPAGLCSSCEKNIQSNVANCDRLVYCCESDYPSVRRVVSSKAIQ